MLKENLSAYMDGEDHHQDGFLDHLCEDESLQSAWREYHMIRSVMQNESEAILGDEFTARMANIIEDEASDHLLIAQPTPNETHQSNFMQKLKGLVTPLTQVGIAAGVCLVAVVGVQSFNNKPSAPAESNLQTLPFNTSVQPVSYNAPLEDTPTKAELEKQNRRIGAMLQNYELQRRTGSNQLGLDSQSIKDASNH